MKRFAVKQITKENGDSIAPYYFVIVDEVDGEVVIREQIPFLTLAHSIADALNMVWAKAHLEITDEFNQMIARRVDYDVERSEK